MPEVVRSHLAVTHEPDEPCLYYGITCAQVFGVPYPPEGYRELFRIKSYGNSVGIVYEREQEAPR